MYLDSNKYQVPFAPFLDTLKIDYCNIQDMELNLLTSLEDLIVFPRSVFKEGDTRIPQGCSGDMRKIFLRA